MSTTNEIYVALPPAGTLFLLMNFMVLVPFTPRFSHGANRPISFAVDFIHRILQYTNVMSLLFFHDLPLDRSLHWPFQA
jgi:hypothetical protein